jgi:PEP-CTERM motif
MSLRRHQPAPAPSALLLLGIGAISLLGYRKAKSYG